MTKALISVISPTLPRRMRVSAGMNANGRFIHSSGLSSSGTEGGAAWADEVSTSSNTSGSDGPGSTMGRGDVSASSSARRASAAEGGSSAGATVADASKGGVFTGSAGRGRSDVSMVGGCSRAGSGIGSGWAGAVSRPTESLDGSGSSVVSGACAAGKAGAGGGAGATAALAGGAEEARGGGGDGDVPASASASKRSISSPASCASRSSALAASSSVASVGSGRSTVDWPMAETACGMTDSSEPVEAQNRRAVSEPSSMTARLRVAGARANPFAIIGRSASYHTMLFIGVNERSVA